MLGPLPRIHRIALVVASLLVFAVAGAWVFGRSATLVTAWGPPVGLVAGALVAFVLLHDSHHRHQPRGSRVTRR